MPASSASCSVCETCGRILRNNASSGVPNTVRLNTVGTTRTDTMMKTNHSVEIAAGDNGAFEVKSHNHTPIAATNSHELAR